MGLPLPRLPADYMRIPDRLNLADATLDRQVRAGHGDRVAIYYGDDRITYRELQRRANQFGNALARLGIGRGDRFLIRARNCPEYAVAFLGGIKAGAVPIPSNSLFRPWELEHSINNSGTKAVFTTPDLVEPIRDVRPRCPSLKQVVIIGGPGDTGPTFAELVAGASEELAPAETHRDELAFIVYTSGTTGKPKGVEHAHRWIVGAGDPVTHIVMQIGPEDICFQPQEISFIYSLGCCLLYPLRVGAAVVLEPARFEPEACLAAIQRYRVTLLAAVPTIFRMLIARPGAESRYDLSSLRFGISAGEPLPEDTYHEAKRRFGIEVYDFIGQSEIHGYMGNWSGLPVKPGSVGLPLPPHAVSIADDAGAEVAPGEVGHIVLRQDNPGLALGYRGMEDRWADLNRRDWFYTGDMAYRDPEGYFWYVSRSDDLIKSRAYLISPKEVEAAIMEHPAVLEAGVVGVPDPILGQKVKAFVTLRPGNEPSPVLAEEITERLKGLIAPYKAPKEIEFVADLPKTATGKVLRRELRARAQTGTA